MLQRSGFPCSHSAIRTQASPLVPVAPSCPVKAIVDQETATWSPDVEAMQRRSAEAPSLSPRV